MMYLSKEQCRAARGLLNWTQQDLATHTGLSKTSINNFERGISNVKTDTLTLITTTFAQEGVLFLDHDGLQRRQESLAIVRGSQALTALFDDMIEHSKVSNDTATICATRALLGHTDFIDGLKRLKKHGIPHTLYKDAPYDIMGMSSFAYGFKVAFYYNKRRIAMMIESPHGNQAEKERLQTGKNTIK